MNKILYITLLGFLFFLLSCGKQDVDIGKHNISNNGRVGEIHGEKEGLVGNNANISESNGSFSNINQ